jgi:hypothetical protein
MDRFSMSNDLYKALKEGVVTVEFTKIDTDELRVMPCTLNQEIHKQTLNIKNYSTNDTMFMYGLDVKAWRDVKIDTIQKWYPGYPQDKE